MSSPSQNRISFSKNETTGRVTIVLERRSANRAVERSQFTISERAFNRALVDAQITVPWFVSA